MVTSINKEGVKVNIMGGGTGKGTIVNYVKSSLDSRPTS
jgi:hypothetical protein